MPFNVEMPDGTVIEDIPDGTPKEVIRQKWVSHIQSADRAAYNPTNDMGAGQRFAAGAGKAVYDIGRGIGQMLPKGPMGMGGPQVTRQDVTQARATDAPLMDTAGGKVGNFAGNVALAAPTAFVPGANTVAGAGLVGAGLGFLQPSTSAGETAMNTGAGLLLGSGGQKLGQTVGPKIGNAIAGRKLAAAEAKSANSVRDATLSNAQKAGYVVPPSTTNPTTANRVVEGISGKAQTQQAATVKNQKITNGLVRKELGLTNGAPLTVSTLNGIRKTAGQAYKDVANSGDILADAQYLSDIDGIAAVAGEVAKDFPGFDVAGSAEIQRLQQALGQQGFSAKGAVEMLKHLRHEATSNLKWNVDDPAKIALGRAQREAAGILEDQVIRHLESIGKADLAKQFDESRRLIAKTYSVQAALNEGTGNVVATKLGGQLRKGKPLSGGLETAAKFAEAFPKAAGEQTTSPGVSAVDALIGMAGGATIDPSLFALPVARIGARSALLSGLGQRAAVPGYGANTRALELMQSLAPLSSPIAIGIGNTK